METKLVFTAKVYDLEEEQFVQGGFELSIPEELADQAKDLFQAIGKRGYKVERFGVAQADNGLEYDKDNDSPLFDNDRMKWSYSFALEQDGDAIAGSTGL